MGHYKAVQGLLKASAEELESELAAARERVAVLEGQVAAAAAVAAEAPTTETGPRDVPLTVQELATPSRVGELEATVADLESKLSRCVAVRRVGRCLEECVTLAEGGGGGLWCGTCQSPTEMRRLCPRGPPPGASPSLN